MHRWLWVVGAVALGSACATTNFETKEKMAESRAAVRAAEAIGADQVAPAALHLQYARDQISRAQRFLQEGDAQRAAWILERAEADANLAYAFAREVPLRNQALEAQEQVQRLQEQSR